ncbi:SDR family NAD(P)-dependent oxidoreductase [Nocardia terpenica]|uniref:SDR family NAD(P)-dependent oxidoreductase n=2 Tax=Nocardia terpenica TaxID=455432 RepID=A0A6G9ZET0_9NOCA|nr:SDR family NAD(P)-dependent oxidoreductase [Nocardia terpenica]
MPDEQFGFEPIAVVGLGCRLAPDIASPEQFWAALLGGVDATGPLPQQRWEPYASLSPQNTAALRGIPGSGAYLTDITGFDADFFGISPREAEYMDPAQRLMLEVVWEALEHAGIPPTSLSGSDTGVFLGSAGDDYLRRMLEDLPTIGLWSGLGGQASVTAGRISYVLDLKGPCMAIDTACSSSLMALHTACQSLRLHESSMALVGGVNVMAAPGYSVMLDALGAISPDGRSKPFSADADGYGRGEGAGVLVLKRLGDARRDGDRVLSVIRGTTATQDGRSSGIMAPAPEAQKHLLRNAYRAAAIDPGTVDYIEAHGTGTPVGDPVEVEAIAAVLAADRPADRPVLLGSVKGNIGHLEAGAGVSSVIKTVLALQHGLIPATLHTSPLNPAVDWDAVSVRVVRATTRWPDAADRPRRAGVTGLGYGGSIAHAVLEGVSRAEPREWPPLDTARIFPLSAASEAGLRAQALRLADWLEEHGDVPLRSVGHTLALRRSHLPHRAAVVAREPGELVAALRGLGDEGAAPVPGVASGRVILNPVPDAVWVFSGHGSQWSGMGRELLGHEPEFAAVIDELEPVFAAELGYSLRDAITTGELGGVDRIQSMIFAIQVGLAAVWRSRGLRPTAVIGHSVGEIAAAVVAGALRLGDAARLVCRRSALLRRVAGQGAMFMVDLPFERAADRIGGHTDVVAAIAAAPSSTVVSGTPEAVETLAREWGAAGLTIRRVDSDVAFHSPQMDALATELATAVPDLDPAAPAVPLYSTVGTDPLRTVARDGAYWAANLREPVRFVEAVEAAIADGHRLFLEISGHPVVSHSIGETLEHRGEEGFTGHSLRRNRSEPESLLAALAALHCHGGALDWQRLHPDGELVDLPTTAWQRRSYWLRTTPYTAARGHDPGGHTLLGSVTTLGGGGSALLWQTYLDTDCRPYPGDHVVGGIEVVPASVVLHTFLTAAGGAPLREIALRVPLRVVEASEVQVVRQDGALRLSGRPHRSEAPWVVHATAGLGEALGAGPSSAAFDCPDPAGPQPLSVSELLDGWGVAGLPFPWKELAVRGGDGGIVAEVAVQEAPDGDGRAESWAPLLDAAMTLAPLVLPDPATPRMPTHIGRAAVYGTPPARALLRLRAVRESDSDTVDLEIADADGTVLAELHGLRFGGVDDGADAQVSARHLVHELVWRPLAAHTRTTDISAVTLVGDPNPLADRLSAAFEAAGVRCVRVVRPEELADSEVPGPVLVVPAVPDAEEPIGAAAERCAWLLTRTAQCLIGSKAGVPPRLWCLTSGVRGGRGAQALAHAPLWGIGRVIAGEHPELWGGTVDLDQPDATALLDVLAAPGKEDVIALTGQQALVARLAGVEREPDVPDADCRPDGTYLITGGLGALGLEIARWLASRGARRLLLAGRRALPDRARWDEESDPAIRQRIRAVRELEAMGVTVRTIPLDITDRAEAARLLDTDALELPPIRGVVHAAGTLSAQLVHNLDEAALHAVMRPKVEGALVLNALFPPGSLDFLVLFSSSGPLIQESGLAAYGAANAFLDAFAVHRNRSGDRPDTTTFAWAAWRGLGMAAGTVTELYNAEAEALGVADITAEQALRAWEFAVRHRVECCSVMRVLPLESGAPRLPLLSELSAAAVSSGTPTRATDSAPDWSALPPEQLHDQLLDEVQAQFEAELGLPEGQLDVRRPLADTGLDSIMTVAIRARLQRRLGTGIPTTLLWTRPTVRSITDYLAEQLTAHEEHD